MTDVDAVDPDAATGEFVGVTAGAAPDVEHPLTRLQAEHRDDVIDLLHRALGVRIPVVGRAEVIGEILEPMVAFGHVSGASRARSSA